jgi:ABC-type Fe3+ transport system permease subunit
MVCVLAGACVRKQIASASGRLRYLAWVALLVPYLTPALIVGYAYSNFSLSLVRYPFWNELLYDCPVWMKLASVAALLLYLAPTPYSAEAVHCRRLLRAREAGVRSLSSYFLFLVQGPLRPAGVAFAVVFLLAFGEFEMASLFGVRTWTVSLFDAHAGGLAIAESLALMALPMSAEIALLLFVWLILLQRGGATTAGQHRTAFSRATQVLIWAYLLAAGLAVTAVPAVIVLRGTVQGIRALVENFVLWRDIGASVLFAAAAATCAYVFAATVAKYAFSTGHTRRWLVRTFMLAMPGLLGPLVLSLLIVFVFQSTGLRAVYDTPIPLVLALWLLLLPLALLLQVLLQVFEPGQPVHAAVLLASSASQRVRKWRRKLIWELSTKRQFWVLFLLFCWGYFDFTASSILAPPAMTPVTVRLYNLAHYGQSAVLSAMVCAASCVPLALILVAEGARSFLSGLPAHE